MAIEVSIHDPRHPASAKISENGEVIIRAFDYSTPVNNAIANDTTAINYFRPKVGQQLILTGLFASANRSIGANGDVVDVYEASSSDSTTQDTLLFSFDIARQQTVSPNVGQIKITEGKYLNADRDETAGSISLTISGFYVPAVSN